jgi:hypothetical protein
MRRMRFGVFLCLFACFAVLTPLAAVSAQSIGNNDSHQMNAAEYSKHLDRIDVDLGKWEASLRKIDPGKGDPSYTVGKQIADNLRLALMQVVDTRSFINRERIRRTIYGELALGQLLTSLNEDFNLLAFEGAFNDLSVETVSDYAKEIGFLQMRLMNDAMRRVEQLEAGKCGKASE